MNNDSSNATNLIHCGQSTGNNGIVSPPGPRQPTMQDVSENLKSKNHFVLYRTITLLSFFVVLLLTIYSIFKSGNLLSFSFPTFIEIILMIIYYISLIVFIIFLILTIVEHNALKRAKNTSNSSIGENMMAETSPRTYGSGPAIASLVSAIIPLVIIGICVIASAGSTNENNGGAIWWILVIYLWTAGFPLYVVWLICGLAGLKSPRRRLAIISLVILPSGIALLILISFLLNALH